MMGVICDMMTSFIRERSDQATLERVMAAAGMPGKNFSWHEIVPEEDWQRLLQTAAKELDAGADGAERLFAEFAAGVLVDKFGSFFRISRTGLDLLRKVAKIHLDLPRSMGRKTQKKLVLAVDEPDRIIYHYRSPNRLCVFLIALAERIFAHYGETGYTITEHSCIKRGDDFCEIEITAGKR